MKFKLKDIQKLVNQYKTYSENGKIIEPAPTGNKFLDDRYETMRNPEGYVHPYYRFFYALAREYVPKVIVELGAWQGTSAAHFAGGSPDSLVITIDHHSDAGDEVNWAKTEAAAVHFENLYYCKGWTCNQLYEEEKDKHHTKGYNAFPCVKDYLLRGKTIDLLFIDSWHHYDQAMKDWEAYKPSLSKGALVICDDIYGGPDLKMEAMLDFWEQFDYPKFLDGQIHPGYPMGFMIV